ncbi:MAG: lipocalin family protein [Alphaproteobacteria bacterium]|nr:lipocalin family protein [Alphaproteobacteria bacterium]
MHPRHSRQAKDRKLTGFLRVIVATVLAIAVAGCEQPPVNRDGTNPLTTVAKVELERYLGRWYEVARYENSFEKGCVGVTATYSRNADGSIKVVNLCRKGTMTGPQDVAEGRATVADPATNAKLSVSFFWPFTGDYWVIGLADDYSWALVGEPSGRYLWILSRAPQLTPELRADLIAKLQSQGYNTNALYWTPQS